MHMVTCFVRFSEMASPIHDHSGHHPLQNGPGTSGNGPSTSSKGGDSYYNSMVAAAIIAAFAILALLIVTALYLKRTTTYKAIISGQGNSKSSGVQKINSAAFKVMYYFNNLGILN